MEMVRYFTRYLLQNGNLIVEWIGLSQYFCNNNFNEYLPLDYSIDWYSRSCITWYPNSKWLYIIILNRIFIYNNQDVGVFSDISINNVNIYASKGCSIDNDEIYIWIKEDIRIDINKYNIENYNKNNYLNDEYIHIYNSNTRWPKMIPLTESDNFIYISTFDDYYVLYSGNNSRTKHGISISNNFHTFSVPIYTTKSILTIGGFFADLSLIPCDPWINAPTCDNPTINDKSVGRFINVITYYPWQRDFYIKFETITPYISFGDSFMITNEFVSVCDLSYYYNNGKSIQLSINEMNPFVIAETAMWCNTIRFSFN